MCLLIFTRIPALNPSGRQTKSCNFTKISKAQKLKNSHCPLIDKIVYYFAQWNLMTGVGGSVPENGCKSGK